jgi:hypothetical protein
MPAFEPVDALITFYESWRQEGVGDDGLPLYVPVVMIRKAKPPLLQVDAIATPDDEEQFAEAWRYFQKTHAARDPNVQGYPLVLWPVCTGAELQMLAARDIVTVEQLARLAERDTIPQLKELAVRAKKMIALQSKTGKFEEVINQITAERDVLVEQLKEANATISAQNALINTLKMKAA